MRGKAGSESGDGGRRWDHPRTCGEKGARVLQGFGVTGSPPHMRGKGNGAHAHNGKLRITPAHAGKRNCNKGVKQNGKDHPRTCGEKFRLLQAVVPGNGSPPHMRGKALHDTGHSFDIGITPAHAGKSGYYSGHYIQIRDHPRTCGEKMTGIKARNSQPGSPPHMRGKDKVAELIGHFAGITPAHAGKSQRGKPHAEVRCGSPPHMRGKAGCRRRVQVRGRITPAHAGKRCRCPHAQPRPRDHPRTCGEKLACVVAVHIVVGSPPHMRGKEGTKAIAHNGGRITPAHAGKSHPAFGTGGIEAGSPPHMRGKAFC